MQKKLIALAIAGLSGAAFAQSNVTIYGAMDATYDNVSATGSASGLAGSNYATRGRTTMNSSFFGLKGSEGLGNGLTVAWQIENGIGENGGATNTVGASVYGMATRDTYIALAGSWGTVAAGTLTGPARALGAAMDVNVGATGIGNNGALIGKLGGGTGAGYFDTRFANAIAYISPTFSGFSAVLAYVPNENRSLDNTTPAAGIVNTTGETVGLNYNNGPIMAGYAWTKLKDSAANNTTAGTGFGPLNTGLGAVRISDATNNRLAFKYTFAQGWTAGLLWDQTKATVPAAVTLDAKQTVWYLPITYTTGAHKVIFQYGKANNVSGSVNVGGVADFSAKHIELGYEYSLSKRTTAKVLYSAITNSTAATYDFLYGVSAPNSPNPALAGFTGGADPRGISVGLRHTF